MDNLREFLRKRNEDELAALDTNLVNQVLAFVNKLPSPVRKLALKCEKSCGGNAHKYHEYCNELKSNLGYTPYIVQKVCVAVRFENFHRTHENNFNTGLTFTNDYLEKLLQDLEGLA